MIKSKIDHLCVLDPERKIIDVNKALLGKDTSGKSRNRGEEV
ncbi:MAG: hypothetical protein PHV74_04425 [Dehalococcoidia bacterium]|nr:hypothetical protein [Dehalococcoidia bacterium]